MSPCDEAHHVFTTRFVTAGAVWIFRAQRKNSIHWEAAEPDNEDDITTWTSSHRGQIMAISRDRQTMRGRVSENGMSIAWDSSEPQWFRDHDHMAVVHVVDQGVPVIALAIRTEAKIAHFHHLERSSHTLRGSDMLTWSLARLYGMGIRKVFLHDAS